MEKLSEALRRRATEAELAALLKTRGSPLMCSVALVQPLFSAADAVLPLCGCERDGLAVH